MEPSATSSAFGASRKRKKAPPVQKELQNVGASEEDHLADIQRKRDVSRRSSQKHRQRSKAMFLEVYNKKAQLEQDNAKLRSENDSLLQKVKIVKQFAAITATAAQKTASKPSTMTETMVNQQLPPVERDNKPEAFPMQATVPPAATVSCPTTPSPSRPVLFGAQTPSRLANSSTVLRLGVNSSSRASAPRPSFFTTPRTMVPQQSVSVLQRWAAPAAGATAEEKLYLATALHEMHQKELELEKKQYVSALQCSAALAAGATAEETLYLATALHEMHQKELELKKKQALVLGQQRQRREEQLLRFLTNNGCYIPPRQEQSLQLLQANAPAFHSVPGGSYLSQSIRLPRPVLPNSAFAPTRRTSAPGHVREPLPASSQSPTDQHQLLAWLMNQHH